MNKRESSYTVSEKCLKKLKVALPNDPAITLLGFYSKLSKSTLSQRYLHIIVSSSSIHNSEQTRFWNKPGFPTTEKWVKKMWYMHRGTVFSHKEGKWIQLKIIILSKLSQCWKDKEHMPCPSCSSLILHRQKD